MDRVKLDDIIAKVSGVLNPSGLDCIEAEWIGNERILRLFVDVLGSEIREEGKGIDLNGCVRASRLLEESPELDETVGSAYTLEVSSPGIERPLRRSSDFVQHIGETIQVKLRDKHADRRNGTGKLVRVDDGEAACITLDTAEGQWSFPLASLQRANLVYDWGASAR